MTPKSNTSAPILRHTTIITVLASCLLLVVITLLGGHDCHQFLMRVSSIGLSIFAPFSSVAPSRSSNNTSQHEFDLVDTVDEVSSMQQLPYPYEGYDAHGPSYTNEEVMSIMTDDIGLVVNSTYETFPIRNSNIANDSIAANVTHARIFKDLYFPKRMVHGHYFLLDNPLNHFSILEPVGGCGRNRQTVMDTARAHNCLFATNAGFFNTKTGDCHGNLVSDGNIVQNTGVQNANFGLTKDGRFVIGYIADIEEMQFQNLVAGVIWLVRNGQNFVEESLKIEYMKTQESGSGRHFVDLLAPRIALGHDKQGRLLLVALDGNEPSKQGLDLHEMANLMIELGAVNAINLDGGGSVTVVEDGHLVNFPSDPCKPLVPNKYARCERKVTTITCIHDYNPQSPSAPPQHQSEEEDGAASTTTHHDETSEEDSASDFESGSGSDSRHIEEWPDQYSNSNYNMSAVFLMVILGFGVLGVLFFYKAPVLRRLKMLRNLGLSNLLGLISNSSRSPSRIGSPDQRQQHQQQQQDLGDEMILLSQEDPDEEHQQQRQSGYEDGRC